MKELFDLKFLIQIGTMLVVFTLAWASLDNGVSDALATDEEQNEKIEAIEDDLNDIKSDIRVQTQDTQYIKEEAKEAKESRKNMEKILNQILLNTK